MLFAAVTFGLGAVAVPVWSQFALELFLVIHVLALADIAYVWHHMADADD